MSNRLINLALKTLPPGARKNDGDAIGDLATEMVESGDSRAAQQAAGIVGYAARKRFVGRVDWTRGLPWGAALWTLAPLLASFQLAWLILAGPIDLEPSVGSFVSSWWFATFLAAAITLVGAIRHNRAVLGFGSAAVLALFLFDGFVTSPGQASGHGADFGFGGSVMNGPTLDSIGAAIPFAILLVLASFANRSAPRRSRRVEIGSWLAFVTLPAIALTVEIFTPHTQDLFGQRGLWALFAFVLTVTVLMSTSKRSPHRCLAAAMLLVSQVPLFAWCTVGLFSYVDGVQSSSIALLLMLINALPLAFIAAISMRVRFGRPQ